MVCTAIKQTTLPLNFKEFSEPTKYTLRDDQKAFKNNIYQEIKQGKQRILAIAPCAFGKTVVIASIVEDAVKKGKNITIVVPFLVLIPQTEEKLINFGINPGIIAGGTPEDRENPVQIASVQTLSASRRDLGWHQPDIVLFDECHLSFWSSYALERFPNLDQGSECDRAEPIVIGLTATPYRLSRRERMCDRFQSQIIAARVQDMVEAGRLVPNRYFPTVKIDLNKAKVKNGEYVVNKALLTACVEAIDSLLENYLAIGENRKFLVFGVNIEHASAIADKFNDAGIPTALITEKTTKTQRKAINDALRRGEYRGISSINTCGIGFDLPEVSCILMARPTKSKALYVQLVGRGQRLHPDKKDCLVIDQSGCYNTFGVIESILPPPLIWEDLPEKQEKEVGEGEGEGTEREKAIGTASEILIDEVRQFYRVSLSQAMKNGYKPGWALYQCRKYHPILCSSEWEPPNDWVRDAFTGQDWNNSKAIAKYLADKVSLKACIFWLTKATGRSWRECEKLFSSP